MFVSVYGNSVSPLWIILSIIFSVTADIFFLYRIQNLADEMKFETALKKSKERQKQRIGTYLAIQKETEQLIQDVHDTENHIYEYSVLKNKGLDQQAQNYIRKLKESYAGESE